MNNQIIIDWKLFWDYCSWSAFRFSDGEGEEAYHMLSSLWFKVNISGSIESVCYFEHNLSWSYFSIWKRWTWWKKRKTIKSKLIWSQFTHLKKYKIW